MACGLREVTVMDVDVVRCADSHIAMVIVAAAGLDAAGCSAAVAAVRRKVVSILDAVDAVVDIVEARRCDGRGGGEREGKGDT
jgi:hypothetical protein